ncbi:hypothetical protein HanRHA438_Chr04g0201841 [Helianthus annuus]|nr:hypothetical protein HanRHA438_Chr04g0201841 [Helianthus annuus]
MKPACGDFGASTGSSVCWEAFGDNRNPNPPVKRAKDDFPVVSDDDSGCVPLKD